MKKENLIKKFFVLSLSLILVLSLVACGGSANSGTEEKKEENKTSSVAEEKKEENKTEYNQDEIANFKDVEYSITKVKKSSGNEFSKPKKGKEFVIVSVKIENKSEDKISHNPFDWKMENSEGQESDVDFSLVDSDTALESADLKPGGKVEGTISFEQPIGDKGLKLNYYDNALFDENPSFQFKIK